ncbi:MAG: hypothetical protein ACLQVJ_07965 [Syntrophobacteraceae bacterium]
MAWSGRHQEPEFTLLGLVRDAVGESLLITPARLLFWRCLIREPWYRVDEGFWIQAGVVSAIYKMGE